MADEVQATPDLNEGRAVEAPPVETQDEAKPEATPESDDDLGVKWSLDDVPEVIRPRVEARVKEIEKQFKGAYTKKTQTLSEERKGREAEYTKVTEEHNRILQMAAEVLRDPSKYEHYRRIYGFDTGAPAKKEEERPLETVEDLMNAIDQKVEKRLQATKQEVLTKTQQERLHLEQEQRWDKALVEMRQEPRFKKYEQILIHMSDDKKYKDMFARERDEKKVLKAVLEDFNGLFREDLETAKQQGLGALEAKKKASTAVPGKTPTTVSTQTGSRSVEDIIKAVRAKVPK